VGNLGWAHCVGLCVQVCGDVEQSGGWGGRIAWGWVYVCVKA